MYYVKIHERGKTRITAICDKNILGKTFEEGEMQINISERFYKGEVVDGNAIVKEMFDAEVLNIIGNKIVELALKNNIIKRENIANICGVAHAEIY